MIIRQIRRQGLFNPYIIFDIPCSYGLKTLILDNIYVGQFFVFVILPTWEAEIPQSHNENIYP